MSNLNLKHTPAEKPLSGRAFQQAHHGRKLTQPFDEKVSEIDWSDHPIKNRPYTINLIENSKKKRIYTPRKKKKKVHPKRSKTFGTPEINLGVYKDSCRDETGN